MSSRPRKLLLLGFTCSTIHAFIVPLFSWVLSNLVSTFFATGRAAQEAFKWAVCILALSMIDGAACFGFYLCFEYCGQVWVDSVRLQAMMRIIEQPMDFFATKTRSPTHLAYNLDRNPEEMRNLIGRFISFAWIATVTMILTTGCCLVVCWKLTLIGIVLAPISWIIMRIYGTFSRELETRSNDASETAASAFKDAFASIKTVWALNIQSKFREKHNQATTKAFMVGIKRALICGAIFGLAKAVMILNYSLVLYFGAIFASSQDYTVQEILLVISLLLFALGNVTNTVIVIPQMSSAIDSSMRLLSLATLLQHSHEHTGDVTPSNIGGITLSNVNFNYEKRPNNFALRGVNVTFPTGMIVALVGTSGSGKSTIASILLKLYQIQQCPDCETSSLLFGQVPLERINTKTLRNLIGIVPQNIVIFPTTVKANIAYALPRQSRRASLDSIRAAAVEAGIDDFLSSLPDGYNTIIGEGGLCLSGGQTQRIAIARALLREPKVLILDEPTSALDCASVELIGNTIKRLAKKDPQMTIILITHSREMMLLSDRMVVMDRGQVIEEGPSQQLLRTKW